MLRIIDYKRIDLTDQEWNLYQEIARSYDRPNFKGADLFKGLFETDNNGIIVFLKPPTEYTSMEVFLFMINICVHQHLRQMYKETDFVSLEMTNKMKQLDEKMAQLDELLIATQKKVESTS